GGSAAEALRHAGGVRGGGGVSGFGAGFVSDRIGDPDRRRGGGRDMKLLTFVHHGGRHAGGLTSAGIAPIEEINAKRGTRVPNDLLEIIRTGVDGIDANGVKTLSLAEVAPRLPYEVPPKIWCIGLNYLSHAEDINAVQPEEPGSFMKPASCMFQPGG